MLIKASLAVFALVSSAQSLVIDDANLIAARLFGGESVLAADTPLDMDAANKQLSFLASSAQETARSELDASLGSRGGSFGHGCTKHNIKVRKEWGALSGEERIAYTDAVRCLQQKQASTPSSFAPGAKSRFDDFVVTHMNQTGRIHQSGLFLTWHRYYTWQYEQTLVNECGYQGTQPYWDWAKSAVTGVENSPIFDGSPTSMSGNGEKVGDEAPIVVEGGALPLGTVIFPPGTGGGCVTSGPFKDMTVNLGPALLVLPGNRTASNENPYLYNPRCLKRDLTTAINRERVNATSIMNTISKTWIYEFETFMQGIPYSGDFGIHGGGHYIFGGDPGRDIYVAPGDPVFYLHHSMIDRVWWIWQMMDKKNRVYGNNAIFGTQTILNLPPSANVTFDTPVDLGYTGAPVRPMRDLMSTTAGPFCYIYE